MRAPGRAAAGCSPLLLADVLRTRAQVVVDARLQRRTRPEPVVDGTARLFEHHEVRLADPPTAVEPGEGVIRAGGVPGVERGLGDIRGAGRQRERQLQGPAV